MNFPYKAGTTVKITSPYGNRTDPFGSGKVEPHWGLDLVGSDKNIVAISPGKVGWAGSVNDKSSGGYTWQWGNYVRIDTNDGHKEYYCHMQSCSVKVGQIVKAGDVVGVEGATGNVTGRHLHFEVRTSSGVKLNTAEYLGVPNVVGTYQMDAPTLKTYPQRYDRNGLTFVEATNFAIWYHDTGKRSGNYTRYVNGGFFASYRSENGTFFTLPVGNLVCNIRFAPYASKQYLMPHMAGGKLRYDCNDNQSVQFRDKKVSTLIVPNSGAPYIADVNSVPPDTKFAISGVPTVRNGDDVDYYNYVQKQGWDSSCMYATYRSWLGIRDGKIWLITGKTTTKNYIYGMEFWNKVKDEGFDDIICIDGGGSYYWKECGMVHTTSGNRQINTVIVI